MNALNQRMEGMRIQSELKGKTTEITQFEQQRRIILKKTYVNRTPENCEIIENFKVGAVAYFCNTSHSGGRVWEGLDLRTAQAKKLTSLYLNKLARCDGASL
jgi:hypothetical protein